MPRYRWGRTKQVQERLEDRVVNGKYEGRFVIARDTHIDGGVYLGGHAREAIVVDSRAYPGINLVYARARELAHQLGSVLDTVHDLVRQTMQYDEAACERIIERVTRHRPDAKIRLDHFIIEGVGVCRHMALLAGVLIEKFKHDGVVRGRPSIDRNERVDAAHVWVRYVRQNGEIHIVDPAHSYFGPLVSGPRWDYRRLEDMK